MRISNEPLFAETDEKALLLEQDFRPLDTSLVWNLNSIFWKHYDVWVKTYGEEYQDALPNGLSQSHEQNFIRESSKKFFNNLVNLQRKARLPDEVLILEQGPGTGEYAQGFLDNMKNWSTRTHSFYEKIRYILSDESDQMLIEAKKNLHEHVRNVEFILQKDLYHISPKFRRKILMARHGNLWDQLPCRMFKIEGGVTYELYARAVLESDESQLRRHVKNLQAGDIEKVITQYSRLWKSFVESIKLQTKLVPLTDAAAISVPYYRVLEKLLSSKKQDTSIIFSPAVLENCEELYNLIDWQRGGYFEIVDIIAKTSNELKKQREPRKFDGTIACAVHVSQVREFMQQRSKHVVLRAIRQLNTELTCINNDLETQLNTADFTYMAEVAAGKDQSTENILSSAMQFSDFGMDSIAFSDQAHGWDSFLSIEELLEMSVFELSERYCPLPVFATRRKSWKVIYNLVEKLKAQHVRQVFVVTGDPSENKDKETDIASLEVLPKLSQHFFVGAVAKANIQDIPKLIQKMQAGAKFFIVQSTYDEDELMKWIQEVKRLRLHKTTKFIMSIIPIVTSRTIRAIQDFPDVPISRTILKRFHDLSDKAIREEGLKLAQESVRFYIKQEIFSGLYIFTKSPSIITSLKLVQQNQ